MLKDDAEAQGLVRLSGRGEGEAELAAQAVRDPGAEVTTLRSTWFSQNFSESYFLDGLLTGQLALPAGETPEPSVDADDIADVAVAALTEDGQRGEIYELIGPRLGSGKRLFDDADGPRVPRSPASSRPSRVMLTYRRAEVR